MRKSLIAIALLASACSPRPSQDHSVTADSLNPLAAVLQQHTSDWMSIPGVTGTGETEKEGKPAILILVDTLTDTLKMRLPSKVEGYPVIIQETGEIRALPAK